MAIFRFIPRPFAAIGMCCLIVFGSAPRIDCLCPDSVCQFSCEFMFSQATNVSKREHKPACCCNHEAQPVPNSGDGPTWHNAGCDCQMHVVRCELAPAVRNDGKLPPPVALWLASDRLALSLSRPGLRPDRSQFTGLAPDDPVSRAQILRL